MERSKLFFFVGSGILALAVVIGVIFFLRSRAVEEETLPVRRAPVSGVTKSSRVGSSATDRRDLTPAEQKRADEVTAAIRAVPKDQRTTWTPEFRKQMESKIR